MRPALTSAGPTTELLGHDMNSIATFLMFVGERHGKAEEAVRFWTSLFRGASIGKIERWGPGQGEPEGTVRTARFVIGGRPFMAMDSAAPHAFGFTPAISLFIECDDEAELDTAFAALQEGGVALMPVANYGFSRRFGWVQDRFGVSWQLNLA